MIGLGLYLLGVFGPLLGAAGVVRRGGRRYRRELVRRIWDSRGTLWSLWHLPLHFLEGTWYHGMGLGSVRFWLIHLLLAQLGVLFVWLANGSGGSILIAILAHTGAPDPVGFVHRA